MTTLNNAYGIITHLDFAMCILVFLHGCAGFYLFKSILDVRNNRVTLIWDNLTTRNRWYVSGGYLTFMCLFLFGIYHTAKTDYGDTLKNKHEKLCSYKSSRDCDSIQARMSELGIVPVPDYRGLHDLL